MRTFNKSIFALLAGVTLLFSSCEKDPVRIPSPEETGGFQAYFLENNPTSVTITPSDEPQFKILVGRKNTDNAATIKYGVIITKGKESLLELSDSVVFSKGENVDTVLVDCSKMKLGDELTLSLKLNEKDATIYGAPTLSIAVARDYLWIDRGSVEFTDTDFALGKATIPIEMAKGTQLFRLKNLYSILSKNEKEPFKRGYHLKFYLDTIQNWKADKLSEGLHNLGTGYELYYNTVKYAKNCTFTSKDNEYKMTYFLTPNRANLYLGGCSFVWKDKFPGKITDPYEGDTKLSFDWTMTSADCTWYADKIYENAGLYYLELGYKDNTIALELLVPLTEALAPLPAGEYDINSKKTVNTAVSGVNLAGGEKSGTYVSVPSVNATLYLVEGKVKVEKDTEDNYTITINGKSFTGSVVKAKWTGKLNAVAAK